MKRVIVCGDSFCEVDPDYPGLHWTEKLLDNHEDIELINLAYGGCSNAMIAIQLLYGLNLNPDFVILSFTSVSSRKIFKYDFDVNPDAVPFDTNKPECVSEYLKSRYSNTNKIESEDKIPATVNFVEIVGEDLETLKNYIHVSFCLDTLSARRIDFCYSLGGLQVKNNIFSFLKKHFLSDNFSRHENRELSINLWNHDDYTSKIYHHVPDHNIHMLFANECESKIWKN
jgi:hypothetical protein